MSLNHNATLEQVLKLKNKNFTNKMIANELNISLRMVEKTLQLYRFLDSLKGSIDFRRYEKLVSLNYKALEIRKIKENIESINILLDNLEYRASLNEIKDRLNLVLTRQEKIKEMGDKINIINAAIENNKSDINNLADKRKMLVQAVERIFGFIIYDDELEDDKKNEIFKSIAYDKVENKWIFVGIIDKNRFLRLTKDEIIIKNQGINECNYIIPEVNRFIKYIKRSRGYTAELKYSYLGEEGLLWLGSDNKLINKIDNLKEQLAYEKRELALVEKGLKEITDCKLSEFMALIQAKNEIFNTEVLNHNRIAYIGMIWLVNKGYIADMGYVYKGYKFDVIGVNVDTNKVIILEVKESVSDYKQDLKKYNYLAYAHEVYIITNNLSVKSEVSKEVEFGCIYVRNDDVIEITKKPEEKENVLINPGEIVKSIYKQLWEKIYV